MVKQKISRKKLLKEPDEFITFSARMLQFISAHRTWIQWGLAGVLGVVLIGSAWTYWIKRTEKLALIALGETMTLYASFNTSRPNDDSHARIAAQLEALIKSYPNTGSGKIGKVLYGTLSFEKGNVDKGIEMYRKALKDFEDENAIKNIILSGLGHAYLAKKDIGEAKRCFEEMISGESSVLKDEAFYLLGSFYGKEGNKEKKWKLFEQILSNFPNSLYSGIVKEEMAIR